MLTTAGMGLVLAIAVTGCHNANGQNASNASGDPSDVNAAAAQNSCPAGQVLMSDNSCAPADQSAPAPTQPAPTQPAQTQPAPQAPPQNYPSQQASAPASQPAQVYAQAQPQQPYDQSGNYNSNSGDYESQNSYDDQTYQQDVYNDGYQ